MGLKKNRWPSKLRSGDDLYAVENLDTQNVEYLIYSSSEKSRTFVRDAGQWLEIKEHIFEEFDDPKYSVQFVDVDFIDYYDEASRRSNVVPFEQEAGAEDSITAAAAADCPPATLDIALNLKNRTRCVSIANYGPLNPNLENEGFWKEKAEAWSVTIDEAKQSLCANCVFFVVTTEIKNCIAAGLDENATPQSDAFDSIDAGELGYCEAFDFKCAASRTCDAWAVGGPIDDAVKSSRGA
jgi:hypothetical protein